MSVSVCVCGVYVCACVSVCVHSPILYLPGNHNMAVENL